MKKKKIKINLVLAVFNEKISTQSLMRFNEIIYLFFFFFRKLQNNINSTKNHI